MDEEFNNNDDEVVNSSLQDSNQNSPTPNYSANSYEDIRNKYENRQANMNRAINAMSGMKKGGISNNSFAKGFMGSNGNQANLGKNGLNKNSGQLEKNNDGLTNKEEGKKENSVNGVKEPKEGQTPQKYEKDLKKDTEKQAIKGASKEALIKAASAALQAYGVPAKLSEKLLRKIADDPNIDKIIDKQVEKIQKIWEFIKMSIIFAIGGAIAIPLFIAIIFFGDDLKSSAERDNCGNACGYTVNGEQVYNVSVRLLQCGDMGSNNPIDGEELVPFEKYILGVVYAEVDGSDYEVYKAQAVAARTYSLLRPSNMNGAYGESLKEEDGKWILSLRNCTQTQVYCDPDKGCSKYNVSSEGTKLASGDSINNTTVSNPSKYNYYKGPLSSNSELRQAVAEVVGETAVDSSGNLVNTDYTQAEQDKWSEFVKSGLNYKEALMKVYPKVSAIKNNTSCKSTCSSGSAATGDYTKWKQTDPAWANEKLPGGSTVGAVGCLYVSVLKQVIKSGVELKINGELNPKTGLVYKKYLFSGNNFVWGGISYITDHMVRNMDYDGLHNIDFKSSDSKAYRIQKTKEAINAGCYLLAQVKNPYSNDFDAHWVAIDYVDNATIYMMDSGYGDCTDLFNCTEKSYTPNLYAFRCLLVK